MKADAEVQHFDHALLQNFLFRCQEATLGQGSYKGVMAADDPVQVTTDFVLFNLSQELPGPRVKDPRKWKQLSLRPPFPQSCYNSEIFESQGITIYRAVL